MEKPYKGRAIIQDNITDIQIVIPAKKNWFFIIFIGVWLCGWSFGELFALSAVTGMLGFKHNPAGLFILFWLVGWTIGGFFAFRAFIWSLKGKEIITVGQGTLKLDKKGALLFKPKEYALNEVKAIRVQEDGGYFGSFNRRFGNPATAFSQGGTIRFDYGLQTVKFAADLDEAEAKYIIQQLKNRRLLTEQNL